VRILRGILKNTVYVQVRKNFFQVRHIESKREVQGNAVFTTERLLIGNFMEAENCLMTALKELDYGKTYLSDPTTVIHPIDMTEGGLSEVEHRIFLEVAYGAGSKKVMVWLGSELEDNEVLQQAKDT
jgi:rod shape-determining protein MreB and related proteins